ncbi:MAG: hypothetical protein FD180_4383 [Planctomycetota bacterium]|nr:MAG: hypothetical protein FD180_4383 [Planctomycetota bacterium]
MTVVVRYHGGMSNAEAPPQAGREIRKAIADWLLEVSALMAVFPWLDQLVLHPKIDFNWAITATTFAFAFGLAQSGLLFLCPAGRRRACLVVSTTGCFLTGAVVFWRA